MPPELLQSTSGWSNSNRVGFEPTEHIALSRAHITIVLSALLNPLLLARKNWLFHGNDIGANADSILFSLIETCKQHQVDPFAWFKYVLSNIHNAHTIEQLDLLLPFNVNPDQLISMRNIPKLIFPYKKAVG
ncbi:transposase domain-containing protein [Legionella maceachernii]|uniref:transposase domain-containing protein n=1 Tax=Legionella maceachernii TaxID=466 RepID=UPI000999F712|nr:transposase domain-containing protein [Legionella maceachernii]